MAITLKQIDAELATFTTNRDILRDHAHTIAMMIFRHAAPKAVSEDCDGSGDCTRAVKLVRQMPTSWAEQMVKWLVEFTPIRVKLNSRGDDRCEYDPEYKKLSGNDKLAWWKYEEANSTPFYDFAKEREVELRGFDYYMKTLLAMPSRIEKDIKEGKVADAELENVKAIARAVAAFKVERVKAEVSNDDGKAPGGTITDEVKDEPKADTAIAIAMAEAAKKAA
jgi:hypothetical protein